MYKKVHNPGVCGPDTYTTTCTGGRARGRAHWRAVHADNDPRKEVSVGMRGRGGGGRHCRMTCTGSSLPIANSRYNGGAWPSRHRGVGRDTDTDSARPVLQYLADRERL